ncbi:MAG: hypothetical protein AAFW74_08470, partial [Pseudomonadota bacterium]
EVVDLGVEIDGVAADIAANYYTAADVDGALAAISSSVSATFNAAGTGNMIPNGSAQFGLDFIRERPGVTVEALDGLSDPVVGVSTYFRGTYTGAPMQEFGIFDIVLSDPLQRDFTGRKVRLRVKAKTSDPDLPVLFNLICNQADGSNVFPQLYVDNNSSDAWQVYEQTFELGGSPWFAAQLRGISIRVYSRDGETHTIDVSEIEVRDVTDADRLDGFDADLNLVAASVDEIVGLSVNASTAFGTLMQQLQVNAGGTSAVINQQGAALATVEGVVQAMTGLTAETVDQDGVTRISGIRATSYADPDGSSGALLELLGDNVIAPGSMSVGRLNVGLGGNLLSNTDFMAGTEGWEFFADGNQGVQTSLVVRNPGQSWAGRDFPTIMLRQSGDGNTGVAYLWFRPEAVEGDVMPGYPCAPGEWFEASARLSTNRCDGVLYVQFYDTAGNSLSTSSASDVAGFQGDNENPALWPQYGVRHEAPANAAYVTVRIEKTATDTGSNSFLFIHEPQLVKVHADANELTPYSRGGSTLITGNMIRTDAIEGRHIKTETLEVTRDMVVAGARSKKVLFDNFSSLTMDTTSQVITPAYDADFISYDPPGVGSVPSNPLALFMRVYLSPVSSDPTWLRFTLEKKVAGTWSALDNSSGCEVFLYDGRVVSWHGFWQERANGTGYDPGTVEQVRISAQVLTGGGFTGTQVNFYPGFGNDFQARLEQINI